MAGHRLWLRTGCARTGSAEETPAASRHGLEWKPIQELQRRIHLRTPTERYLKEDEPLGRFMYSVDTNMRRARLLGKERSIVTEKALKCKGMVSVRLEVLSFPEIVERLKKACQDEGCWRLPLPNHIPVQIDKQSLDAALRRSQRSSNELFVGPRDEYSEL